MPAPETPSPVACDDIAFKPQSEDLASNIRATGVDCAQAQELVRRVRSQHNVVSGPRSFELDGYSCTVVTETRALPMGRYSCTAPSRTVTWTKT